MLRIGDKVAHIDYPKSVGRVVAKMQRNGFVLVLWSTFTGPEQASATSRHIPSALRKVCD